MSRNAKYTVGPKYHLPAGMAVLVMVLVFSVFFCEAEILVDRIVAQVNDDIISLSDLNEAIAPEVSKIKAQQLSPMEEREAVYQLRSEMLDELISNKLADQVATEKGVRVSESDVDKAVESTKRQYRMTDEEFRTALKNDGMTMDEFRKDTRQKLLRYRLLNQEIQSKIVITTEDIEAYYNAHEEKYGGKEKYHLRTIIKKVSPYTDEAGLKDMVATMKEVRQKLENGASFIEMAKTYSDLLADEGGDIGNFELSQLSEEIRPVVKNLKPGQFSPLVNTAQGLQIFYLDEIVHTQGVPLAEVSDDIKDILYKEVWDSKFKEWVENLKEKAHIKKIQ